MPTISMFYGIVVSLYFYSSFPSSSLGMQIVKTIKSNKNKNHKKELV